MSTQLSVNVNAIALLRNRRDLPWPSVTHLGDIALAAGADGITIHPRPDQRHIRFTDVAPLQALVEAAGQDVEYNIEGYPSEDFLQLVLNVRPHQVTLVPDDPAQATSDHGWDFVQHQTMLKQSVSRLKDAGMRVCLFADANPEAQQIDAAAASGCDRLELYTGPYGGTWGDADAAARELELLRATATAATAAGMGLNAGHDLTVDNLPPLLQQVPTIAEVSIGHGLTADALEHGMAEAVRRFKAACG